MIDLIDRGASALILLQGGQTPEDASLSGVAKVQQIVAESARGKVDAPSTTTGAKARLETKVVENVFNNGGYSGGTGIGDTVTLNVQMKRQQESQLEETGITKGDDANWEAAVSTAEWNMKLFLNFAIRYNSTKLADDAIEFKKAASEREEALFIKNFGHSSFTPDTQVTDAALKRLHRSLVRSSQDSDVQNGLDPALRGYGQEGNVYIDDRGAVRIKTGDYKTVDGTKYMSIQDDGSITTYNKDGSVRRHETFEDLQQNAFSGVYMARYTSIFGESASFKMY